MDSPGFRVGAYETVRLLGAGGMGEVYLARHRHLDRIGAVKVLLPEVSALPDAIARFLAEARAASVIEHPGIVAVWDCDVLDDGRAYIVMEYLRGESLRGSIGRLGALGRDWRTALAVIGQAADALAAAHDKGIVHRDLKPDNIFLAAKSGPTLAIQTKILDFGIAKLLQSSQVAGVKTQTTALLGTPRYMSPEQCRGSGNIDARSDVYSLGCVLFEVLSGTLPFDRQAVGEMLIAHATEPAPPMASRVPDLPPAIASLVDRMLLKNAADRPQSMREVASIVSEILGLPVERLSEAIAVPPGFPSAAPELPPRGAPSGQTPSPQTPPRIGLTTPLPNPSGALPKAGFTPTGTRKLGATTFSRTASELGTERVDRQRKAGLLVGGGVLAVGLVIGILAFVVRSDPPETKPAPPETKAQAAPPPPAEPVAPKPPANVRVQVTSRPAAELWIEGEAQARGRTPLSLELPRGAAAKATLRAEGHLDLSIDLPTAADGTHTFALAPKPTEEPERKKRRSGSRGASAPQKTEDPYRAVGD